MPAQRSRNSSSACYRHQTRHGHPYLRQSRGVVRWRRRDLAHWLWEEFDVSLDETTVGRELQRMGYAKLSARPRHYAQNEYAVEEFKKTSPTV